MNTKTVPLIGGTPVFLLGRFLLGLYFVGPGIMKVVGFDGTIGYMELLGTAMCPWCCGFTSKA